MGARAQEGGPERQGLAGATLNSALRSSEPFSRVSPATRAPATSDCGWTEAPTSTHAASSAAAAVFHILTRFGARETHQCRGGKRANSNPHASQHSMHPR